MYEQSYFHRAEIHFFIAGICDKINKDLSGMMSVRAAVCGNK